MLACKAGQRDQEDLSRQVLGVRAGQRPLVAMVEDRIGVTMTEIIKAEKH